MSERRITATGLAITLVLFATGCGQKAPPPAVPSPPTREVKETSPPLRQPTISEFAAEPKTVVRGQSAVVRWSVNDATDVSISPGIGSVQSSGRRQVSPSETTTYTLTAKGPGGTVSAAKIVNVTVPVAVPPPTPLPKVSSAEQLTDVLQDAYFDFNSSDIREDARATLTRNAEVQKLIFHSFPNAVIVIEGHCDERGSAEYNLGMGDRRATAAQAFLAQLGVPAERLSPISYGKERPQCTDSSEECWQKNRRVHFVVKE